MGKNNITIYTQNLKNHFKLMKGIPNIYDGKTVDSCLNLSRYLADKDIDFTSLQEMTCDRNHYLQTKFTDVMYYADWIGKQEPFFNLVTGKPRLPKVFLYTHFGKLCGEYNPIVMGERFKLIDSKTYTLPWFHDVLHQTRDLAIMPRIAHAILVKNTETEEFITIINTHIDYNSKKVQELQLNALTSLIEQLQTEAIIITGDFNMNPDHEIFSKYIEEWKRLGVERVSRGFIEEPTWINKKDSSITGNYDHIFTRGIDVQNVKLIDMRAEFDTDHKGILVSGKIKRR